MIFITGCNGLVGSFIARKLLSENYYIRALKRKDSDLTLVKDIQQKIEWVEGDVQDLPSIEKALTGVDTIIHAAAIVSFVPGDKEKMHKVNVEGTANMINAALSQGVSNFLHISSVAAIGRRKNLLSIDEDIFWENSPYNSNYAISKYMAELEVWRGMEEGLKTIIVNPSIVLGPGSWEDGSTMIFKYGFQENLFYPKGDMNFVDVRDVAEIVVKLLSSEKAIGQRFILNAAALPYKTIFELISKNFDKKSPRILAGPILSEIAWRAAAIKTFLTNGKPGISKETAKASQQNYYYKNSKIVNFLNYNFFPAEETIKWVCGELRKKYNV